MRRRWRRHGASLERVLLHALPIFHVHGLFVAINTVLASGSSMLFLSKFDADEVVRLPASSQRDDGRADVLHAPVTTSAA